MRKSQLLFLSLLKSGLWDTPIDTNLDWTKADWKEIEELAANQTVTGIMMDGVVKLPGELRPSKQLFFKLLLNVREIEKANESINKIAPKIIELLKGNGLEPLLLKGQGIASYYQRPNHRMSGDIDLFVGFDDSAYIHANDIIKPLASMTGHDNRERKHVDYSIMGETVEIHGSIKCTISNKCDNGIATWARQRLASDNIVIETEHGNLITPPINFNLLYIFIHFMNHYMNGGIGLRHVLDWMMFLWRNYDKIDMILLEKDIKELGLTKFWAMFASVAVAHLGYPHEMMPLYDNSYDKRCGIVLRHIFNTGNFGIKQKTWQYNHNYGRKARKMITFLGQMPVYLENWRVFPSETFYCFGKFLRDGINDI